MDTDTKTNNTGIHWTEVPKFIWYFLDEDKTKFLISFLILFVIFFYELVPVYIVGKIVDFFTKYTAGQSLITFYVYLIIIAVSYVFVAFIRLEAKNTVNIAGIKARARARIWGFERLTEFSLAWHNKENTGNKLQRIFTGADGLTAWFVLFKNDMLKIFSSMLGVLLFFLFVDLKFMILALIYITVFLLIEFSINKKMYDLSNEFNKFNQMAGGTYVENANNILSIKALGRERKIVECVTDKETVSRDISIKRVKISTFKWKCLQIVTGISLGAFLLLTGFSFVAGTITIGMILVFFTYFNQLKKALSDISDLYGDIISARSDLEQIMPIFNETEFVKTGNEKFPKNWNKIELKNIFMEYATGQVGLKNFNLTLQRNSKNGLAGSSGSGKSTFAKIVLGLYAIKSGEFKISNKNYYSILHNETLDNITVVLQETELFNLSLNENITMMRPVNTDLLEKAIEISQLKEVVDKLPDGIESTVGEKGYMLSGGERQRLGIARAIYKNSSIIIMDEATSSLDSKTESKIMQKLLGEYGKDKTFLIIAHRLGTLKYTDNISVMKHGEVIESGSYKKLMNDSSSIFYEMNQEQKISKNKIVKAKIISN